MFNTHNFLPKTGFEPGTSGIVSDRSTNWATITARNYELNTTTFKETKLIDILSFSREQQQKVEVVLEWLTVTNDCKLKISTNCVTPLPN